MSHSSRAQRMERRHGRSAKQPGLNLVSLMDIFTILVFFLLVNSSDVESLPNAKDMKLPESIAEEKSRETVVVMITGEDILVQGDVVANVREVLDTDGNIITGLKQALIAQNDRVLRKAANQDIAQREVTIMGDKEISYRLLKKVMATCTDADYGQISLAVMQKSSEKLASVSGSGFGG
ncbi:MAG: biopolymer transporter ExbD [Pseudomonadota bacterium]